MQNNTFMMNASNTWRQASGRDTSGPTKTSRYIGGRIVDYIYVWHKYCGTIRVRLEMLILSIDLGVDNMTATEEWKKLTDPKHSTVSSCKKAAFKQLRRVYPFEILHRPTQIMVVRKIEDALINMRSQQICQEEELIDEKNSKYDSRFEEIYDNLLKATERVRDLEKDLAHERRKANETRTQYKQKRGQVHFQESQITIFGIRN